MFLVKDAPNHRHLVHRVDQSSQPHLGPTRLNPWRDDGSFRRVVAEGHCAASTSNLAAGPGLSRSKREAVLAMRRPGLAGHFHQQDPRSTCSSLMSAELAGSWQLQVWIRPRKELGHVKKSEQPDAWRTGPISLDPVLLHY